MRTRTTTLLGFLIILMFGSEPALARRGEFEKWISKKPFISEVQVSGNKFFSDGDIKGAIRSKSNGFWQSVRLRKRHRLKKDSKSVDLAAVSYLYRSNGFIFATIEEEFEVAPDSTAIVKIDISEGRRLFVSSSYSPTDLGSFTEEVAHHMRQIERGKPFNPYKVSQTTFDIKTVYANKGYPYADVRDSVLIYEDSDSADVLFVVDRGPLTLFGDVQVDSLKYTVDHTFLRELIFKPGDIYSRQRIIDSRQRVYSTGLASYVDLSVQNNDGESPSEHDVRPDFLLKVLERKPKFANVRTGAGQDIEQDLVWDLGVEFGNRNISGKGRQVRFELFSSFLVFVDEWRVLKERFAFDYTEPWFLKIRLPLNLRFAVEPGIRSKTQNYRISRIDLGLTTAKDLSKVTRIAGGVAYEKVNITGIPADQLEELKKEEGISVKRKLLISLERDTRNNLLLPIRGSYFRLDAQYVGGFLGGDDSFVKFTSNLSRYQNFYGSNVYAWNYRFGWVEGTGDDPYVPTTDRYYFGGGKTLRGYGANDVGPLTDEGEPAGGRVLLQTNQEIRRPLFWKFWGSVFVDVGNIFEDFEYIKFSELLVSLGAGLQYVSPVGPVRLDYGHRLVRGPYDQGGQFHISILYAF